MSDSQSQIQSRIIGGSISGRNDYPWFCNIIAASDQVATSTTTGVTIQGSATYIGDKFVITAASLFTPYYALSGDLALSANTTVPAGFNLMPQFTDVAMDTLKSTRLIRMGHISTYDDNISVKDYKIVDFHFHPFYSYDYIEFQNQLSASDDFSHVMWSNNLVILELDSIPALDGFKPIELLPKNLDGAVYHTSDTSVTSIGTGTIEISPSDDLEFVDDLPVVIDATQDSIITTSNYYVRDVPLKIIASDDSLWASDTVVHVNNYPCYQQGYLIVYYNTSFSFLALELTSDVPAFSFDTTITSPSSEVNTFFTDIQILFNTTYFYWPIINNSVIYDTTNSKTHPVMSVTPSDSLYGLDTAKWFNWSMLQFNPITIQSPFTNVCYAADYGSDLEDIHDNLGLSSGDDGNPLVYQNSDEEYYLVGVHGDSGSTRLGIAIVDDYYPEIFESIEKHRDWINGVINSSDAVVKSADELAESLADQETTFNALSELVDAYTSDLAEINSDIASSDFSTDLVTSDFGIELSSDLGSLGSDYELLLENTTVFDDLITEFNTEIQEWIADLESFQEAVLVCSSDGSSYYQTSSDLLESAEAVTSDISTWTSDILEWLTLDFATDFATSLMVSSDLVGSSDVPTLSSDIYDLANGDLLDFTSDLALLSENLAEFSSDLEEFLEAGRTLSSDRESLEMMSGPINRDLITKGSTGAPSTFRDSNYDLLVANRKLVFTASSSYWNGLTETCGIDNDFDVSLGGDASISNTEGFYHFKATSEGDKVIRQSRRYFKVDSIELRGQLGATMQAGHSGKIGWFNGQNGYYFMLDSNSIYVVKLLNGIEYKISQSNWNLDQLDDPDLTNWATPSSIPQVSDLRTNIISMIIYPAHEHVIMGLILDGIPRLVHKFPTTHLNNEAMRTMMFPIRYELEKTTDDLVEVEMKMLSANIYQHTSDQVVPTFNRSHMISNARRSAITLTPSAIDAATAIKPIIAMRLSADAFGSTMQVTGLEMLTGSNSELYWEIALNPDIDGTTWLSDIENSSNIVELDDKADVYHNAVVLASGLLSHKTSLTGRDIQHVCAAFGIDETSDVLVLGVRNLGSSNDISFWYKLSWCEFS